MGRALLAKRLHSLLGGVALEQEHQCGDQTRAVPAGLAPNQDSLASLLIAKRGANRVSEIVLV